jgi:transposase InsO family protein
VRVRKEVAQLKMDRAWLKRKPSQRASRQERIEQEMTWFHGDSDEVSGLRADLVEDVLRIAITIGGGLPETVVSRTDRGTQYASAQVTEFATANGITLPTGYSGVCLDNAMAESFFATLKTGSITAASGPPGSRRNSRSASGLRSATTVAADTYHSDRSARSASNCILTSQRGASRSSITPCPPAGARPPRHSVFEPRQQLLG